MFIGDMPYYLYFYVLFGIILYLNYEAAPMLENGIKANEHEELTLHYTASEFYDWNVQNRKQMWVLCFNFLCWKESLALYRSFNHVTAHFLMHEDFEEKKDNSAYW